MKYDAARYDAKDSNKTVDPIVKKTTAQRLDAIVRRHGGTPRPVEKVTYSVPAPARGECKGQRKLW